LKIIEKKRGRPRGVQLKKGGGGKEEKWGVARLNEKKRQQEKEQHCLAFEKKLSGNGTGPNATKKNDRDKVHGSTGERITTCPRGREEPHGRCPRKKEGARGGAGGAKTEQARCGKGEKPWDVGR